MTPTTLIHQTPAAATDPSDPVHDIRSRTAAGTGNPTQDVPQLLAHIEQLQQRLAAAEAVFPGITQLTPGEPVELTIYRAEYEEGQQSLGLYTNRGAAHDHGEDLITGEGTPDGTTLTWTTDFDSADAIEELAVVGPGGDEYCATGYLVTPLTLTAAYTSKAEE
ncbi:hypothetical protein OG612_45210 (plasmid) [Streptomyces sp. NBC_01527]|uniref:hypothetical protein n=1 Tax=Streptomyces sp. NBC_01527 TaxID=2903894 RepID=UPI002F91A0F8